MVDGVHECDKRKLGCDWTCCLFVLVFCFKNHTWSTIVFSRGLWDMSKAWIFFFFLVFRQIAVSYSYSKKHTRGSAFLSLQNTTQWTALIYTYVRHSQGAVRIHCSYTYWYTMFDPGMGSFWGKWPIIIL